MKKCVYCGRENADDAAHCSGCGTADFRDPSLPEVPRHLLFRFLVSLAAGTVVALLATYVAWQNNCGLPEMSKEQFVTGFELRRLEQAVGLYRQKFGALPGSLAKLNDIDLESPSDYGQERDGWGHLFSYSAQGTNYLVTSFGRDGKPGGKGLDCDRSDAEEVSRGGEMLSGCLLAGVATFVLTLFLVKRPDFTPSGLVKLAIKLGLTTVGAVIIGAMMAALHLPVKHH